MSMSDPIADLLTRIRNALLREKATVTIPSSKMKVQIVKVLLEEGFIQKYELLPAKIGMDLKIHLKYDAKGESVIRQIQRISKPGLRIFRGSSALKPQVGGQGISIVSTSKGVLSDNQCRAMNVGGEILCTVY